MYSQRFSISLMMGRTLSLTRQAHLLWPTAHVRTLSGGRSVPVLEHLLDRVARLETDVNASMARQEQLSKQHKRLETVLTALFQISAGDKGIAGQATSVPDDASTETFNRRQSRTDDPSTRPRMRNGPYAGSRGWGADGSKLAFLASSLRGIYSPSQVKPQPSSSATSSPPSTSSASRPLTRYYNGEKTRNTAHVSAR